MLFYARFGRRKRFAESAKGEHMESMKRVLLLVWLIVSLVELDWERYRIYLLSSIVSLLFVLSSELTWRRRVQQVATEVVTHSKKYLAQFARTPSI